MSGEEKTNEATATIAANGRVDRNVGRHGNLLPAKAKPGDECPWCAESGHTGVFDPTTRKYLVCKVCGDKGVLDALSVEYYGTPEVPPNPRIQRR